MKNPAILMILCGAILTSCQTNSASLVTNFNENSVEIKPLVSPTPTTLPTPMVSATPKLKAKFDINSKIGIELSINYLIGKKFAGSEDDHRTYSKKYQSAVTMLRLTPGLKLTTGSEKTNAYARAGMILGLGGKKKYLEDYDYKTNGVVTQKIYHEVNLTGGLSIGFMGALGVEVPLGGSCKFFTELNFISQSWAPTNGKTTTFTVDGIDKLSTLNTREKETNYVSSYSYSSSQYDPNQPSKYLKTYLPMSSIGLNFGLHLMLGKKKSN